MVSSRDEVLGAFDAFDAALDAILDLDYDLMSPAERVRLESRLERSLRRAPAVEHRLIAEVTSHPTGKREATAAAQAQGLLGAEHVAGHGYRCAT